LPTACKTAIKPIPAEARPIKAMMVPDAELNPM
jgi:hypothetical protein